jgi:hypothetical protein
MVKIYKNDDIYVTLLLIVCFLLGLAPSGPLHNYDCLAPATTLSSALPKISNYFHSIHGAERLTTPENPPRPILENAKL